MKNLPKTGTSPDKNESVSPQSNTESHRGNYSHKKIKLCETQCYSVVNSKSNSNELNTNLINKHFYESKIIVQ